MKNFLKPFLTKNSLLVLVIFVLAASVRFYNFPNRVTFWSEQARSLIVSANYIKVKPSLLGQEYFREDSNYHIIYSGALFNYSLVPLLLISNYDPIKITFFFALLNLFTGFVIYLVSKKIFGSGIALFSTLFFLFNDFMIYHSLFIWNYNYLPLIGILVFYYSWKYIKGHREFDIFLSGLFSGIGISLQFLFAPIAIFVLIVNLWKGKKKIAEIFLFILGTILGNLPMVIFDLRHNFYETHTLLQYLIDTLAGKSGATFVYYYLLPFWPLAAIVAALLMFKIFECNKSICFLIILVYLFLNLSSQRVSFTNPTGMPKGIMTSDIASVSKVIANDAKGDFNVSEVFDFDKQAFVLRYFLEFKDGKTPLSVADYPNLKLLYVLSQKGYNFDKSGVWEVSSGGKYNVSLLSSVGNGYAIYKLKK